MLDHDEYFIIGAFANPNHLSTTPEFIYSPPDAMFE